MAPLSVGEQVPANLQGATGTIQRVLGAATAPAGDLLHPSAGSRVSSLETPCLSSS